jgi:lipopolysaccharide transport system ATP-binding protein
MSESVIKVENISKQYRLGSISTYTLRGDLQRWWYRIRKLPDPTLLIGHDNYTRDFNNIDQSQEQYLWALKDINFEIRQGEVLGIIGKNGAGKSTLLKLLSRVTAPTSGTIKVRGHISSLLEVGTGFHPELTGRENIFLNGAILGMTKNEIKKKFDEIVDFAGVDRYIDTPVKRYSSGMYVRLAFAVAAHLEPDILVVDEVLAVGDAEFQKKAIGKMQDVSQNEGRTVIFVSHNMSSIKRLCTKGILLKSGKIEFEGSINDTVREYLTVFHGILISSVKYNIGDKSFQVLEAKLIDNSGLILSKAIDINTEVFLNIKYHFEKDFPKVHMTFIIGNEEGEMILFCDRMDYHISYAKVEKGTYETKLKIPNPLLLPGKYSVTVGLSIVDIWEDDHKFDILSFEISDAQSNRITKRQGYVFMPIFWDLNKISDQ